MRRPSQTAEILRELQEIREQLGSLNRKVDHIMSEQSQQQTDIDNEVEFDQELDTDVKALTAQVTAGQAALDQAIANLQAANPALDTSQLVAARAVLAGDQPSLDAAVAALAGDPNAAPAAPPATN